MIGWQLLVVAPLAICLLAWAVSSSSCHSQPPEAETQALVDFYNSLRGWDWNKQWEISESSLNPCSFWYGVNCTTVSGVCHVTLLQLPSNNLNGTIPSSIQQLSQLTDLVLSSNYIFGKIPGAVGELTRLSTLDLHLNNLTGVIPSAITSLQKLTDLSIYQNSLSGTLPIGAWTNLKTLKVYENYLSGTVPEAIANLPALTLLEVQKNRFTGTIPMSWAESSLTNLYLYMNSFHGPIPSAVGHLTKLSQLKLNANFLSGTIPTSLNSLTSLEGVYLFSNFLSGSIPTSLFSIKQLQYIDLDSNILEGSIPPIPSTSLVTLELYTNCLTGPLPTSFPSTKMTTIWLEDNYLTGTVPASIGSLTAMTQFLVQNNRLHGTIPAALGSCRKLQKISLASNMLTGSLPPSFNELRNLIDLELFDNNLSGSLPLQLSNLPKLQNLYLQSNRFSGFWAPFTNVSALKYLFLQDNQLSLSWDSLFANNTRLVSLSVSENILRGNFSLVDLPHSLRYLEAIGVELCGPLPEAIVRHNFTYLDLSNNALSGPLPRDLWTADVEQLLLSNNMLTGSLPQSDLTSLSAKCVLQFLSLGVNFITGKLPVDVSRCVGLQSLFLPNALLTGTLMGLFSTQPQLESVDVSSNMLSGGINDVFEASQADALVLNAAYNQLTGSLSSTLLHTGRWSSLILTENCFTGTLPGASLCANEGLTELLLSGLHTAKECRESPGYILGISTAYVQSSHFGGELPTCLFALPQLSFLALSANRLRGRLPSEAPAVSQLASLDVSHNALTGTIPFWLLAAPLQMLDLSFNSLGGSIPANVSTHYATDNTTSLALQVNQLSGTLPVAWTQASNINVLNGNMFACEVPRFWELANRPIHDPVASTYVCGSLAANMALLIGAVTFTVLATIVCVRRLRQVRTSASSESLTANTAMVSLLLTWKWLYALVTRQTADAVKAIPVPWPGLHHERMSMVIGVLLLLALPLYAVTARVTSAYAQMYIWVLALALQQGRAVAVVLVLWLAAFVALLLHQVAAMQPIATAARTSTRLVSVVEDVWANWRRVRFRRALAVGLVVVFHVLPVVVVNFAYVYSTTIQLPRRIRVAAVVTMATFKLMWNASMHWTLRSRLPTLLFADDAFSAAVLITASLLNVTLVPILSQLFASPDCFKYLFVDVPTNSYNTVGGNCYWITYTYVNPTSKKQTNFMALPCTSYDSLLATYNSGNYNGNNTGLIVLSTFASGQATLVSFQAGFAYAYQCSFSLLQAFAHIFVLRYIGSIAVVPGFIALLKNAQIRAFQCDSSVWWQTILSRALPPLRRILPFSAAGDDDATLRKLLRANRPWLEMVGRDGAQRSAQQLQHGLVSDSAVLLSFGVLFPPLGLVVLLHLFCEAIRTRHCLDDLRQHLKTAEELAGRGGDEELSYVALVRAAVIAHEESYATILPPTAQRWLPRVAACAAATWAVAIFDVVGRQDGLTAAIIALCIVATLPHLLWVLLRYSDAWCWPCSLQSTHEAPVAVEMTPVYDEEAAKKAARLREHASFEFEVRMMIDTGFSYSMCC